MCPSQPLRTGRRTAETLKPWPSSTGPRTAEGKRRVAQKAYRGGIGEPFVVCDGAAADALLASSASVRNAESGCAGANESHSVASTRLCAAATPAPSRSNATPNRETPAGEHIAIAVLRFAHWMRNAASAFPIADWFLRNAGPRCFIKCPEHAAVRNRPSVERMVFLQRSREGWNSPARLSVLTYHRSSDETWLNSWEGDPHEA
jgi:hypothetical protein